MQEIADLEDQLISCVVWMQLTGAPVDAEHLNALLPELVEEHQQLETAFVDTLDSALIASGALSLPVDLLGQIDVDAVNVRHSPTLLKHLNQLGFNLPDLTSRPFRWLVLIILSSIPSTPGARLKA